MTTTDDDKPARDPLEALRFILHNPPRRAALDHIIDIIHQTWLTEPSLATDTLVPYAQEHLRRWYQSSPMGWEPNWSHPDSVAFQRWHFADPLCLDARRCPQALDALRWWLDFPAHHPPPPWVRLLRSLDTQRLSLRPDNLPHLLATGALDSLGALWLDYQTTTDDLCHALSSPQAPPALRHLSLWGENIGPALLMDLFEAPWTQTLTSLQLGDCHTLPFGALSDLLDRLPALQSLSLRSCTGIHNALDAIRHSKAAPRLRHLDLDGAEMDDLILEWLAEGDLLPSLELLDLSNNPLTEVSMRALAQSRALSHLKALNVRHHLDSNPVQHLLESPIDHKLDALFLGPRSVDGQMLRDMAHDPRFEALKWFGCHEELWSGDMLEAMGDLLDRAKPQCVVFNDRQWHLHDPDGGDPGAQMAIKGLIQRPWWHHIEHLVTWGLDPEPHQAHQNMHTALKASPKRLVRLEILAHPGPFDVKLDTINPSPSLQHLGLCWDAEEEPPKGLQTPPKSWQNCTIETDWRQIYR